MATLVVNPLTAGSSSLSTRQRVHPAKTTRPKPPFQPYPESKLDTFTLALFIEDGKWIYGQAQVPTGEKHTLAEGFKAMQTEGDALKDFDFVIEPLTGAVGTMVFPCILDIAFPVAYAARSLFKLGNRGVAIADDPVRQIGLLQDQQRRVVDGMEFL